MASLSDRRWVIAPSPPAENLEALAAAGVHPVLARILCQRGYTDPPGARSFLEPYEYGEDDNPFRLKGMAEAVFRLRMAIRRGEPVAVYGDFDCDGVTSTVLLTSVLRLMGADARPYIPDRVDEGYGLNTPALVRLADEGVRVVVTVDCGIRSLEEVAAGSAAGLDIIITDHHSVGSDVPPALAVINPQQPDCPYPEKRLAGVGVTYKLVQALYMEAQRRGYRVGEGWHPDDWLDLVAVGTVADVMPLEGENRMLVKRGLNRLRSPRLPGLQALYSVARIRPDQVGASTIGFGIGPRINAAGRLDSAMRAYDLLVAGTLAEALPLAQELDAINRERQEKTRLMQEWAEEQLGDDPSGLPLLFAEDSRFEQGVVGLVASRLAQRYYRPSVVVQRGEDGESHGSCRSIPEFHITRALEECAALLVRFGGHAAAAGFTVRNEHLKPLRERLLSIAAGRLQGRDLAPALHIDAELGLADVTHTLAEALEQLEPTGEGNPQPLFLTRGLSVSQAQLIGAEEQHLRLTVTDGSLACEAIAFRWGTRVDDLPGRLDLVYHVEQDEWNGKRRLPLNVRDIGASEEA